MAGKETVGVLGFGLKNKMTKGIIYYTHNELDKNIFELVQKRLKKMKLPIVSCSLQPINFGKNIVFQGKPGPVTMTKQILTALEHSNADIVFFCEHDVLYHKSHFDFIPPDKELFYYNLNTWRWSYPDDYAITYDKLTSLSNMCAYRKLALDHYWKRWKLIKKKEWDSENGREPYWIRRLGYEPGTKSKRQELIENKGCSFWRSIYPNIDLRHNKTMTRRKCTLNEFKHQPDNWQAIGIDQIPGWHLKKLFNLPWNYQSSSLPEMRCFSKIQLKIF